MSFVFNCMAPLCHPNITCLSLVCHSYVLVCHSYVTRMYSYVTRMSLICLVCYRMSLICARMSLVCVLTMNPAMKRKLTNKSLKEKCEIIHHIEEGMANKGAYKKFGAPKNIISTGNKMESFLVRFANLFSRERLFASKQTNITECFSKVG